MKDTLGKVRAKYWIPEGRSVTRSLIIHKCVVCKRFEGAQPPPLPPCRVNEAPAFSYTGVDYEGPIIIHLFLSNNSAKVWSVLFTCYVTRAVHLDTVLDQSTPTSIHCLKRFFAKRGLARRFIFDNGKMFKATSGYLNTICWDGTVQEYLKNLGGVIWQFNVDKAPGRGLRKNGQIY